MKKLKPFETVLDLTDPTLYFAWDESQHATVAMDPFEIYGSKTEALATLHDTELSLAVAAPDEVQDLQAIIGEIRHYIASPDIVLL